MCKVYEFPAKKGFPEHLEDRLNRVVRELVVIMSEGLDAVCGDEPTDEEYADFMDSMVIAYNELLEKAIDELV